MDHFKQASKKKLRVQTNVGVLSVEQLWDLKEDTLIDLEDQLTEAVEKGATTTSRRKRVAKTAEQLNNELTLSIVSDILDTKQKDQETANKARETRENNQKILNLIAKKKENQLEGLSVEELEKMLQ